MRSTPYQEMALRVPSLRMPNLKENKPLLVKEVQAQVAARRWGVNLFGDATGEAPSREWLLLLSEMRR